MEGRLLTVKYATQRGQKTQKPVLRKGPGLVAAVRAGSCGAGGLSVESSPAAAPAAVRRRPLRQRAAGLSAGGWSDGTSRPTRQPLESETPVEAVNAVEDRHLDKSTRGAPPAR